MSQMVGPGASDSSFSSPSCGPYLLNDPSLGRWLRELRQPKLELAVQRMLPQGEYKLLISQIARLSSSRGEADSWARVKSQGEP